MAEQHTSGFGFEQLDITHFPIYFGKSDNQPLCQAECQSVHFAHDKWFSQLGSTMDSFSLS